jgi:hypothetical protein
VKANRLHQRQQRTQRMRLPRVHKRPGDNERRSAVCRYHPGQAQALMAAVRSVPTWLMRAVRKKPSSRQRLPEVNTGASTIAGGPT